MIKLTEISIGKYKSFQSPQNIKIEEKVTALVGMNEAGKTVLLEGMAKFHYFKPLDPSFQYDLTRDYPRKEFVKFKSSSGDELIIEAKYEISTDLLKQVEKDLGIGILPSREFIGQRFWRSSNNKIIFSIDFEVFKQNLLSTFSAEIDQPVKEAIGKVHDFQGLLTICSVREELTKLAKFINQINTFKNWGNPVDEYVYTTYVAPQIPKFWYFDDYYNLPGRINLSDYKAGKYSTETTGMIEALLEMAGIDVDELLAAKDFESFNAQLEAASSEMSQQLLEYWSGNANLEVEIKVDNITKSVTHSHKLYHPSYPGNEQHAHQEEYQSAIIETVLDIRVKNLTHKITLPLERRSKGFNWFFSFLVWFSKVKNDKGSNYVLLFDEPGLNLHALAQADLLKFLDVLGETYQLIYSTHSPFMIDSEKLYRVRTIVETTNGSIASESIQEKDPNTLFPLQAALGYDIAQNLFISKKNLLVEGVSDLIYLTVLSNLLESNNREGLSEDITLVPVGGLDKVVTFISLIRSKQLKVACLLDTFTDQKSQQRMADLIAQKIIADRNVRFFHEFIPGSKVADIEDMFDKNDYLKLFNTTFAGEHRVLTTSDLNSSIITTLAQIKDALQIKNFNHFRPANKLSQLGIESAYFSAATLNNFEQIFREINKLFS